MKALFIGGTGIISTACTALAAEKGIDLYLLNRGTTTRRPLPANVNIIQADAGDKEQISKAVEGHSFDCVVDWIAFTPDDIKSIAPAVLRHRLILRPEADIEGLAPDDIIQNILASVPVPR